MVKVKATDEWDQFRNAVKKYKVMNVGPLRFYLLLMRRLQTLLRVPARKVEITIPFVSQ